MPAQMARPRVVSVEGMYTDFSGAGFSLWGLVLARSNPHRLKPAPLNPIQNPLIFLPYDGITSWGKAASNREANNCPQKDGASLLLAERHRGISLAALSRNPAVKITVSEINDQSD
jgi:hypothetical protein